MSQSPSKPRALLTTLAWMALVSTAAAQTKATAQTKVEKYKPTAEETAEIQRKADELARAIAAVPQGTIRDALADVEVYHKAAVFALRFGDFYEPRDVAATLKILDRGLERARQLAQGQRPWSRARGWIARGYPSRVDDSIQPFAIIVPEGLELSADHRARLDVVLHGRDARGSEVRFLAGKDAKPAPRGSEGKLTLHVFGRTNNAYRWAGETDVFEAIEAVRRSYPIDDLRIVLRGFSMGGAGAWHLGLHHPSVWSSVEAGAGFSETKTYAKLKDVPPYVEKALHLYDSADYALNAFNVPIVGYGGENDPQLQASTHIVDALKSLGFTLKTDGLITRGTDIDFLRVVGAGMGHQVDPASAKIMNAFHDDHARRGVEITAPHIRFVTYTLKYSQSLWLSIEQLQEHYRRTEVDAEIQGQRVVVRKAENVALLAVDRTAGEKISFGDQEFDLETAVKGLLPRVYFRRTAEGKWRQLDHNESRSFEENADRGKHRDLQGPIDDAFSSSFLCVKGTGQPWNATADRWSNARLDQFARDWAMFLRGDIRIKTDTQVTDEDIENHHLILFGDPGSNRLIARVLNDLPLTWTQTDLTLGGKTYRAADHAPALIAPNPANPHRYVVLNSGHTFGAYDFTHTNALLYPRLGDYGVFDITGREPVLKTSGYFDEGWSLRK